jgi:putative redox protein
MAAPTHRVVTVSREPDGVFTAANVRGGTLTVGDGTGKTFTPTELLLAAIGACTAIDVATLTSRRAEPDAFEVHVDAEKVRDDDGNRLQDLAVTFRVSFPDGTGGDAARELLPEAVRRSHDRLCTVSRTVELGTPVATRVVG